MDSKTTATPPRTNAKLVTRSKVTSPMSIAVNANETVAPAAPKLKIRSQVTRPAIITSNANESMVG